MSGDEPVVTPMQVSQAPAAPLQDNEILGHYVTPDAAPPDPTAPRDAFLKTLDSVEKVVAMIYLVGLYIGLAAATAAMAWVYFRYPDDGNRDFMLFYGGVIYLIGVLGLTTQIYGTRQRLQRRPPGPTLMDQFRSKVQINIQTAPPDVGFIDAASLERARLHVAGGGTVDEACALVNPRYQQLSGWSKDVFRRAVEVSLEKPA